MAVMSRYPHLRLVYPGKKKKRKKRHASCNYRAAACMQCEHGRRCNKESEKDEQATIIPRCNGGLKLKHEGRRLGKEERSMHDWRKQRLLLHVSKHGRRDHGYGFQ
jgi:hypothetical protein